MATLSGTTNNATTTVAISSVGTTDWIHWANVKTAGTIRKSGGGSLISDYTVTGSGAADSQYTNDAATMSWTGGTPTASGSDTNGVFAQSATANAGFSLTIPVGLATSTIVFNIGYFNTGTSFTATLSDGSAGPYTHTEGAVDATAHDLNITLTVAAGSNGQTLTIAWAATAIISANVSMRGISLATAAAGSTFTVAATVPVATSAIALGIIDNLAVAGTAPVATSAASMTLTDVLAVAAVVPVAIALGALASTNTLAATGTVPVATMAATLNESGVNSTLAIAATVPGPTCIAALAGPVTFVPNPTDWNAGIAAMIGQMFRQGNVSDVTQI